MTPYSKIFDRFDIKITDYDLASLAESDRVAIETKFLNSAVVNFRKCKVDLSDRDDVAKQFNNTLSDLEQEIIAYYMVKEWTAQYRNAQDIMESVMTTSSFKNFSPANQIKAVRELYNDAVIEASRLEAQYSYSKQNLSGLG